jgi:hypothetical protein
MNPQWLFDAVKGVIVQTGSHETKSIEAVQMYRTEGELALSIRDRSHVPNTTTSPATTREVQDF